MSSATQTSEPSESDDYLSFSAGAVIAVEGQGITLYPVGMSMRDAVQLLRDYIKAAEQTKGMTRQ